MRPTPRTVRHARGAFTLIELLLVLVILAVLMAIVVPKFTGRSKDARNVAAKTAIRSFETALDAFEVDNGRFPTSDEGLAALVQSPANLQNWHGPYFKGSFNDPWGQPFVYRSPGQRNTTGYDLFSLGEDGREGTDDITNWADQQ